MAEQTPDKTPAPSMTDFADMVGRSVSKAIEDSHPRKVSFGEYQRRINVGRPKLNRLCFENGFRMNAANLSNTEIELLNQISRSGRYIDRLVEVSVTSDGADEVVYIGFNNKQLEQRFDNARKWRDVEDMLRQIVAAQKLENEEEEEIRVEKAERSAARQRHFGEGKATREARERAGV